MRQTTLRLLLFALAAVLAAATGPVHDGRAHAADEPLICVETGEVYVGPYSYDPPDPCVL